MLTNYRVETLAQKTVGGNWPAGVKFVNNLLIFSAGVANVIFSIRFLNFAMCNFGVSMICEKKYPLHILAFCIILPFLLIKHIPFFVQTTKVTASIICVTVIFILVSCMLKIAQLGPSHSFNTFEFMDIGRFFGVVCFSIEGIGHMLPIRNSMQTPK